MLQPENGMDMEIKLASVDLVYPQFGSIPSRRERWTSLKSGSRDLSNFAVMRSFEQSNSGCGAAENRQNRAEYYLRYSF